MKPGLCRLVGNRSGRGARPGQLHEERDLLAGPSQACGSEREVPFQRTGWDTGKETGWCGDAKSFLRHLS